MPLCQICKQREAAVYFTRILNGFKTKMYVCQTVRRSGRAKDRFEFAAHRTSGNTECRNRRGRELSCDRCGMTIDNSITPAEGCSKCYEVFFEPMQVLLNRIQETPIIAEKSQ